jgi:hypothetical protein
MLGVSFAAMLAAGKRADLESALAEATKAAHDWHVRHDGLKYAFDTLCGAIKKLGFETGTKETP